MFRPIHTKRAFEEICARIREQLALGVLKPGDKLPAERDLAQQLGVSRNVLREALRSLEMAGVLRLQKGVKGGAFVHGRAGQIDPEGHGGASGPLRSDRAHRGRQAGLLHEMREPSGTARATAAGRTEGGAAARH